MSNGHLGGLINKPYEFSRKTAPPARESLTTVQKHNAPLAEATTSSLEAFKAYSAGWKIAASKGTWAAIPFFKRAIDLDPKLTGAWNRRVLAETHH